MAIYDPIDVGFSGFPSNCAAPTKLPRDISRRRGEFLISSKLLTHPTVDIFNLMSNFLIFRAEYLFNSDVILYSAISPLFKYLEKGYILPKYRIIIRRRKNLTLEVRADLVEGENEEEKGVLRRLDV